MDGSACRDAVASPDCPQAAPGSARSFTFDQFARIYPQDDRFDLVNARIIFDGLALDDRNAAVAGASLVRDALDRHGFVRPLPPAYWLMQRRWEAFSPIMLSLRLAVLRGQGLKRFDFRGTRCPRKGCRFDPARAAECLKAARAC